MSRRVLKGGGFLSFPGGGQYQRLVALHPAYPAGGLCYNARSYDARDVPYKNWRRLLQPGRWLVAALILKSEGEHSRLDTFTVAEASQEKDAGDANYVAGMVAANGLHRCIQFMRRLETRPNPAEGSVVTLRVIVPNNDEATMSAANKVIQVLQRDQPDKSGVQDVRLVIHQAGGSPGEFEGEPIVQGSLRAYVAELQAQAAQPAVAQASSSSQ